MRERAESAMVEVWLSPQTIVVPGSVKLLRPDDVDDALPRIELVVIFDAASHTFLGQFLDLLGGCPPLRWSTTASVFWGARTLRPDAASPRTPANS